jgi:hypothetical protein
MRTTAIVLVLFVGLASVAQAEVPCTYYAAPVEAEGGKVPAGEPFGERFAVGTPDKPIPVTDFWTRKLVKPGTVLCLKDGEYRGAKSMIRPPRNQFAGRSGARVEIRAVHDGRVWIDGEFRHSPLNLIGQSYWTVQGLNLFNARGPVVGIAGQGQKGDKDQQPTHHVVLRRLVAWRDFLPYGSEEDYAEIGGANIHIFSLADVSDVVVEDCAGFGWARKIFQNYRSRRVVFRRNWARWDGRSPYKGGNKFAFSCSYMGYDAICENLIATVGGSRDRAAQSADYAPGVHLIATDGVAAGMRWVEPSDRDPFDIELGIYGSLAYSSPSAVFERVTGFLIGGNVYPSKGLKGVLIADSVAATGTSGKSAAILRNCDDDLSKHPDGCSWESKADRAEAPLRLEHVTLIAAREPRTRIRKDWRLEDVKERSWDGRGDIYRSPSGGASLCHRYVEGRETKLPLWPWPMQERIRVASERSSWPTADVMGEITELFGEPPAECAAQ